MKTFKLDAQIANFDYDCEWGKVIGPKSVQTWLKTLKEGEDAVIEINSPGGSVIAGLAIANAVKNAKAHVRAHIVGIAASMASVVACACERVVMEEGSFVMIHDPWVGDMSGNADDLRKEADLLDSMKRACMGFYRAKFDRTEDEIAEMMRAETWWNGHDAHANGFACEVVASDVKVAACACRFENLPEGAAKFVADPLDGETLAKMQAAAEKREREAAEEARFSERLAAAMKSRDAEINALKSDLAAAEKMVAENAAKLARLEEAENAAADFKNQLDAKQQELDAALAESTSRLERAEKAEREFAECRNQLATLKAAHAKLMGGVLTPRESELDEFSARLAAAKSPEEREAIRAERASKIN